MVNITNNGPQPIKTASGNTSIITGTYSKRNATELLPGVNQTDTLQKFFDATVNHLIQPEDVEFLSGYIGSKPPYYDSQTDFYINEPSETRKNYQLPVTAVSLDPASNNVNNVMFYDDLLSQLNLQGANVENPNRLLEAEYYSWSPPIDLDKFINFYEYYWLPNGPAAIELDDPTDISTQVNGKQSYTYTGKYTLTATNTQITGTLPFTSGMRIIVKNDVNYEINDRILIVEGVGRSIKTNLDPLFKNPAWDTTGWNWRAWDGDDSMSIPDYMTIGRSSTNGNRWSTYNRWFHKSVIEQSGLNVLDLIATRAQRPVIEFNSELSLFNFGTYGRPEVDLIDTIQKDIFGYLVGKTPDDVEIDGTTVIDGMRILVTADLDPQVNNRVYQVGGIFDYGAITLTLVADGQNTDGSPAFGDSIHSYFGEKNGDKTYRFNGKKWVIAQQLIKYQAPYFAGYDQDSNSLNDPAVYPASTFNGCKIFSYYIDPNAALDPVLKQQVKRDQFGDYVFSNNLSSDAFTFLSNGQKTDYPGYMWYLDDNTIGNSWYKAANNSRQYILNSFDVATPTTTFLIDNSPAKNIDGQLPCIYVYLITAGKSELLYNDKNYTVKDNVVSFNTPAPAGSRVEVKSWSESVGSKKGYYLLPPNLISNPNNIQPNDISFSQILDQFSDIIANQANEASAGLSTTNWRDSHQARGLGLHVLQHQSPLLKLMLLNSSNINTGVVNNTSLTDPSLAIQFAQKEYIKFYNKFIRSLFNLYSSNGYDKSVPVTDWINHALKQVNLGKSKASAWAYSGYEQKADFSTVNANNPTFVPPTAARLGVASVYKPQVFLDTDYYPAKLTIQTHDGARIVMEELDGTQLGTIVGEASSTSNPELLTHPVASAWLQFELNLYNGLPEQYKTPDTVLAFDLRIYKPGKWRNTEYSRNEYLNVSRASFDKWIINNQVDYTANVTFNQNNQFSFNYRTCVDKDGQSVPGHWRGIYKYFYDTDRPHTHPWEMLGFSQKPTWWESEYGSAPYTRGNKHLWEDLRDGFIRHGNRAGYHTVWARPGLMKCIPADDQGDLLPPILAGVITSLPSYIDSQMEWQFGDNAPIEQVWLTAVDSGYVAALISYLLKPARFIEQGWDPLRTRQVGTGDSQQWIYLNTNSRRSSSQFFVHRENPSIISTLTIPNESSLTFFGSWGIQHWVSEYLINQNLSVSTYFGNIIRGSYGLLAHKLGGFINTDDSLRVLVDSFGQIGYTSQLIPSENIHTYIYKSSNIGVYFYSGVIVVKIKSGYKIYGYDGIKQYFTIIPSIVTGPKTSTIIGNCTVTEYLSGKGTSNIMYGTVLETRQDVYDFLISYGRWLEHEGWIFDTINENSSKVINWKQSARDFVYWSQGSWSNGNFIALSPAASSVKFKKQFGIIQYVNGTIGGTYPVLDKTGQPIESQNLEILRQDDEILVQTTNTQTVFGLRLFVTSIEHVMLLDNQTQFGDLIYDPVYTIFQPRVKLYGYKTNQWTGRLDAPGYFLYQDATTNQWTMLGNFDKTAQDFANLYNTDQPKNVLKIDNSTGEIVQSSTMNHAVARSDLGSLAKHLIGYQPRAYLENLLLDQTTQFEFYQGFIKQKGTKRALENMLRTTNILSSDQSIDYYEEFAFRTGRYGAVSLNRNIDFILSQNDVVNNPQRVDVFSQYYSDQKNDGVIQLVPRDSRIVVPPENYQGELFPLRTNYNQSGFRDLPTAGYVQLGETTYWVVDQTALLALSSQQILKNNQTIWQFISQDGTWEVYKVVEPTSYVISTTPQVTESTTNINFATEHGILAGDIIATYDFVNNSNMVGTFIVSSVSSTSITIPVSTFIEETSGTVLVLRSIRFYDNSDLQSTKMLGGWKEGDLAYVDNTTQKGLWQVYKRFQEQWLPYRKANLKVHAELMLSAKMYDKNTFGTKAKFDYFDPLKGCIPGAAGREITFRTVYDPAQYNKGDATIYNLNTNDSWADNHVGEVWWDLSTTRYIDYEQGDLDYRAKNWGRLAPSTDLIIYEWIRSPISPTDWSTYVATGLNLSQYGIDYAPSGIVKNSGSPAWTERTEYDANGTSKTWYYFWVGNSSLKPTVDNRTFTTVELSSIIKNPSSNNLPWYAAIGERSVVIANCMHYLNADNTVLQIMYTNKANDLNDHKEYTLIRKDDPRSIIDEALWLKLKDSFTGVDSLDNQVPDIRLHELNKYGTLIRPRQTWFKDRLAAIALWVKRFNNQLLTASIPLVEDTDKNGWLDYFTQEEPAPTAEGNWDYAVNTTGELFTIATQMSDGDRVYLPPLAANNNLWTIWTWDGSNSEFVLTRQQSYKVSNYWKYVDWYADGYDSTKIPTYTVSNTNQAAEINLLDGETIYVTDYSSRGWALYGLVNGVKEIVGLQDGTLQLSSSLYENITTTSGFDQTGFDSNGFDYNPCVEFGIIFDGIKNAVYGGSGKLELNQLFFAMVNYVFNEQGYVDWVFKSSFILVSGSNEPLSTSQLYKPNTVDNLLDYINEIKPYRTKIREFISGRSTSDSLTAVSSDFDKPVYDNVILDVNSSHDRAIMSEDSKYTAWYNNYIKNPQLIRKLKTRLVFDRVASMPLVAEVSNATSMGNTVRFDLKNNAADTFKVGELISVSNVVNQGNTFAAFTSNDVTVSFANGNILVGTYTGNIGIGTGVGGGVFHQTYGAADRILREYSPTTYMPGKYAPDLISGTDYKGTVYTGTDFNLQPGWGIAPWDFAAGWDADEKEFDKYLDVILEGGMPPVYDVFYGDGERTQFKLSKIPQDLYHTKIWKDGQVTQYGIDYIVPNWASAIEIAKAGTGYSVGEKIELIPNNPTPGDKNIVVEITTVNSTGGITGVKIVNAGFFTIVQHQSFNTKYINYQLGTGTDAILMPVWAGDTVVFTVPPQEAYYPNIWVLYAGTTFEQAPEGAYDIITDGNQYVQPDVEADHAEELYTTKLKDSVRIDVYSQPSGGMPSVIYKSYTTDGIKDHYEMGVRPQNNQAVNAYLDGQKLTFGVLADYVINYETAELVFVRPPIANKVLTITTIGEGGSGNTIRFVQVIAAGDHYTIGDSIVLNGGTALQNAVVQVTAICISSVTIIQAGSKYKTGELLFIDNQGFSLGTVEKRACIKVTKVTSTGAIQNIEIVNAGRYLSPNPSAGYISSGAGKGAIFSTVWGVADATVTNQGLYVRKPTTPFVAVPDGLSKGATFNALYTSIIDQKTIISDGTTTEYKLKYPILSVESLMITSNGYPVTPVSIAGDVVTIPVQDEGLLIVITQFNTYQYSSVYQSAFFITLDPLGEAITTYKLPYIPYDTRPTYLSLKVKHNGVLLDPPNVTTTVSNGSTTQYDLPFEPATPSNVEVYVDGVRLQYITDYNILMKEVLLDMPPPEGAVVTTVIPEIGKCSYTLNLADETISLYIALEEGNVITLETYSQDLAYQFATETFSGNDKGTYKLAGVPSTDSSLHVTVNGVFYKYLWDYSLVVKDSNGLDINPFGIEPYDLGLPDQYFIVFNNNFVQSDTDIIVVQYFAGKIEKPNTAFRCLISPNYNISQVLSDTGKTVLLNDLYINTSKIEVADSTALTMPKLNKPGYIWVENELIQFNEARPAPTVDYPNKAVLSNILRGAAGTSSSPANKYTTTFLDGDGNTTYFKYTPASNAVAETVRLDNQVQVKGVIGYQAISSGNYTINVNGTIKDPTCVRAYVYTMNAFAQLVNGVDYFVKTSTQIQLMKPYASGTIIKTELDEMVNVRSNYYVCQNPPSQTPGTYIIFDGTNVPSVGDKNVCIISKFADTNICHKAGVIVQDAGGTALIPGGYKWEAMHNGLQYGKSDIARFLVEHPGSRS